MVVNLISTVLVIAIHYGSKGHIQPAGIGGWNYIFQEFALNGIARIGVPFFALLSGFFLALQLESKKRYIDIIANKAETLLLPYLMASLFIFLVVTAKEWAFQHESHHSLLFIL